MTDQRESVRSNAKYLRNVRPIDPEEIYEYVDGQPHPAVVRQFLREEATDLGLIEREDGTFVPVPEEPVPPLSGPVRAFPAVYERRLDDRLAEEYGPDWHEAASGDLLRSTLRRTKARYLAGGPVTYDRDVAAAYAIYHLPGYYAAIQYALDDLAERGLLGRRLRVLDVGAGVGGPALGLADYLPEDALLEYHAVEPSAAADVLDALLAETGPNVHWRIHRETAEEFDPTDATPDGTFDLVLLCNVLSELDDPVSVARRYCRTLADDGSLLAMAPADRETSIGLRRVERAVETPPTRGEARSVRGEGGRNGRATGAESGEGDRNGRATGAESGEGAAVAGGEGDRNGRATGAESGEGAAVAGGEADRPVTVYGPMPRLWPGAKPSDRGWSFDVRPDLAVPDVQSRLDGAATDEDHAPGEFVNVDVQFAYSILRVDGARYHDAALDTARWARMGEMDRHVSNRIDLVAAKVSHSLSDDAEASRGGDRANPLFKISDGSEARDHYAVVTKETALNRALSAADYGDLLAFESVLALWNDDEEAYNLVVDEETIVDPLG